jgi:hypothetical protein
MTELSSHARRVVELARNQDDPTPEVQRRVERALSSQIALGGGAAATGLLAKSALAAKVLLPVALAVTASGAGWYAFQRPTEHAALRHPARQPLEPFDSNPVRAQSSPPGRSSEAEAVASEAVGQPRPATPAPLRPAPPSTGVQRPSPKPTASVSDATVPFSNAPVPKQTASVPDATVPVSKPSSPEVSVRSTMHEPSPEVAAPKTTAAPRTAKDPLVAETEALRAAQRALRSGDAESTLELLDAQDRTYRAGALHEERAAARVLALCQRGDLGGARAAAERFVQRWPRSALRGRVISACRGP